MRRSVVPLVLASLAATLLGVVAAHAVLTERGDLFIRFDGGIAPNALPRAHQAPVAVRIDGTVRTRSGERPPAMREIRIELNRGGRIHTAGLPLCPRRRIVDTTRAQALAACRGALVGTGTYLARTSLPEQEAFPTDGRILAFNSRVDGRRAILAHVYGTEPVALSRVFDFYVSRRRRGPYGTVLRGVFPASSNRHGYLRRITLNLHRTYRHRGRTRSYVTAACAAPHGFARAVFPFARARMRFADGRALSSTVYRSCRVRGAGPSWDRLSTLSVGVDHPSGRVIDILASAPARLNRPGQSAPASPPISRSATSGSPAKPAASALTTSLPRARAVAAMIRSCAPRGRPARRVWASRALCARATSRS